MVQLDERGQEFGKLNFVCRLGEIPPQGLFDGFFPLEERHAKVLEATPPVREGPVGVSPEMDLLSFVCLLCRHCHGICEKDRFLFRSDRHVR